MVQTEGVRRSGSLVSKISEELRGAIAAGDYQTGDRLPSESELTRAHSVSRAVVREAIAILRSDGLVEARKGAGVYVLPQEPAELPPFSDLTTEKVSGAIELLEIRSAFEIRAAGLAAARRSGVQLEAIIRAHEEVGNLVAAGESTREADFLFHYAIAEATQNRRFPEFLSLIRHGIVPRAELGKDAREPSVPAKNPHLQAEHAAIVEAIVDGDPVAAENAMKVHLDGSLLRYRALLRTTVHA